MSAADATSAIDIDRSVGDFSYPESHEFDAGIGLTDKTIDYIYFWTIWITQRTKIRIWY